MITDKQLELLKEKGITVTNGKIKKSQSVKAAMVLASEVEDLGGETFKVSVSDSYKKYFSDFNNLKSTFEFLEYAEKQLGCPLEWSDDEKCFYIYPGEGKKCDPKDLLKILPNLISK